MSYDPFEDDDAPQHPVQKKNFPQQAGEVKVPGPITLDTVTDKDGANYAIVKVKGYWDSFICDKGKFRSGQELPDGVTLIGKKTDNEQYPYRYSLAKGSGSGGNGGFGGGGGRSNWQPKTAVEVHGSNFAGIIKSGIESSLEPDKIRPYLTLYMEACTKLSEVKS